jgi:16S rRNA (uracil1498-N3)-methyltransferase
LTATPLLTALQRSVNNAENSAVEWAVLIGPEGGFSPDEKQLLLQYCTDTDWCVPVSLGSTVLRSETAAMYALSCCSAVADAQRAVEPAAAAAA